MYYSELGSNCTVSPFRQPFSQSGIMPHAHLASHSLANALHQHPCASLKVASWPIRAAGPVRDRCTQHCCCGVHRQSLVQRETEKARSVTCSGFRQTQDQLKQSRTTQVASTQLLAKLLEAPNTIATAKKHVNEINEEFFMVASTYMDMAKKEGNTEICTKLETVLKIAMAEKQKTLRPEIQLLNNLIAATDAAQRDEVLADSKAKEALSMNNDYFSGLLDRMIQDVGRQPDNAKTASLKEQLHDIRKQTTAMKKSLTIDVQK